MYIVERESAWDAQEAAAKLLFTDACAARDKWTAGIDGQQFARGSAEWSIAIATAEWKAAQKVVEALPWSDDPGYFRANIWGMRQIRTWMSQGQMWDEEAEPIAVETDYHAYGLTEEDVYESDSLREGSEKRAAYDRWSDASTRSLIETDSPAKDGGIPPFKVSDNSGWHVTPDEITTALAKLRLNRVALDFTTRSESKFEGTPAKYVTYDVPAEDPKGDAEWFASWVQFLERAVGHGGFRVY